MTSYEWNGDVDEDDSDENDKDDEDEVRVARKNRVNATALRRTCSFIRHETSTIYHTTSTIKLWETVQNALHTEHLELPIVQHVTIFWFKMSMEDVDCIVDTPHLSEIIRKKLPILRRLQETFDKGRVGKAVEFVDAAWGPACAFGAPHSGRYRPTG